MSDRCENCGQKILNTDTICWHCGWQLPEREETPAADAKSPTLAGSPNFSLSIIATYAGLTILILIAVLWTMLSLGQQPQNLSDLNLSLAPGWALVMNRDQTFALHLPPGWQMVEKDEDVSQPDFASNDNNTRRVSALLTPFLDSGYSLDSPVMASDTSGLNGPGASFLLIIQESGPDSVSPEGIIEVLQRPESGLVFLRAVMSEDSTGLTDGTLFFDMSDNLPPYRCQAEFTRGRNDIFLLIACAPQSQFSAQGRMLQAVLGSFRLLSG